VGGLKLKISKYPRIKVVCIGVENKKVFPVKLTVFANPNYNALQSYKVW
jgi:hypothetical protein